MRHEIPAPLIAVVADIASTVETHAGLDSLFMYAGAPGDPPTGSKHVKALEWLRQVNKLGTVDPLTVVGRIIEGYMEAVPDHKDEMYGHTHIQERQAKLTRTLAQCELQYLKGGRVVGSLATPSRTLEQLIRDRDMPAINEEFDRALRNVESNPREAVSAACNLLESLCKTYIQDEALEMPPKQDLQPVWNVVRKHLGLDPSRIEDSDLQQILTGIFAVVSGIGALRTHASAAHGSGRRTYTLEPRHARLAVHAAHTIALFVLESWQKRKG